MPILCDYNCRNCSDLYHCEVSNIFRKHVKDQFTPIKPIPEIEEDLRIRKLEITKVIFNNPATIVFWSDGGKTVVKVCDGEQFDPEKGLAMAISKRFLKYDYKSVFKKYVENDVEACDSFVEKLGKFGNAMASAATNIANLFDGD